jgi:excisionase family DNA binding protein
MRKEGGIPLIQLIRPDELAKSLGVPKVTIYTWVRRGVLPYVQLGKCIRFDPTEINTWIAARKKPAA